MGLFDWIGKKARQAANWVKEQFEPEHSIAVGSSVSPLDDWTKRPKLLPTIVVDEALFNTYGGVGEAIIETFILGVRKNIVGLPKRADKLDYYNYTGQSDSPINTVLHLSDGVVKTELGLDELLSTETGTADIAMFATRYLFDERPDLGDRYVQAYKLEGTIVIELYNEGEEENDLEIFPLPSDYDEEGIYVYAMGTVYVPDTYLDTYYSVDVVEPEDALKWDLDLEDITYEWDDTISVVLIDPETTEPVDDPDVTTTVQSETVGEGTETVNGTMPYLVTPEGERWEVGDTSEIIDDPDHYITYEAVRELVHILTKTEDTQVEEVDGLEQHTTTITYTLEPYYTEERTEVLTKKAENGSRTTLKIYKIGSGIETIDNKYTETIQQARYYPAIPIKIDTSPGSNKGKGNVKYVDRDGWGLSSYADLYSINKKLTRKIFGRRGYDDFIKGIKSSYAETKHTFKAQYTFRTYLLWQPPFGSTPRPSDDAINERYDKCWPDDFYQTRKPYYIDEFPELKGLATINDAIEYYKENLSKKIAGVDAPDNGDPPSQSNYEYLFFGASIRTNDPLAQRYLWEFFRDQYNQDPVMQTAGFYQVDAAKEQWDLDTAAKEQDLAQHEGSFDSLALDQLKVFANQDRAAPSVPPATKLTFKTKGALHLNYWVKWLGIAKDTGVEPGKKGDMELIRGGEIYTLTDTTLESSVSTGIMGDLAQVIEQVSRKAGVLSNNHLTYKLWVEDGVWESYSVKEPTSASLIYNGEWDKWDLNRAYSSDEGGPDVPLLIPLNTVLFKRMGIFKATELGAAACYLFSQTYVDIEGPWYSAPAYKWAVVAIAVTVSVMFPGPGTSIGMIVASAVGAAGIVALVIAAAVNLLVAFIITRLISEISVAILGEKWGKIIGNIIAMVVTQGLNSYASTGHFDIVGSLTSNNLINFTMAGVEGFNTWQRAALQKDFEQTQEYLDNVNRLQEELDEMIALRNPNVVIDMDKLAEGFYNETPQQFFDRTSMVGSDIAEATIQGIHTALDLDFLLKQTINV